MYSTYELDYCNYIDLLYSTDNSKIKGLKGIILSVVRSKNIKLTIDSTEYLNVYNGFSIYYESLSETIHLFLYKVMRIVYSECLDIKLFSKYSKFKNKKQYDYSSVFSLEKFSKLGITFYFCSQFPMIIKPLD